MSVIISGTTGIDAGSLPVANTGKISAGTGLPVILNTAGVDRVTVDTSGNVGIGTSSPQAKLHIKNNNNSEIVLDTTTTGTTNKLISVLNNGNSYSDMELNCLNLKVIYGTTERMRIDTAGNVGIGTSSPTQQLHVRNASGNCNIIAQYGTGNYGGILASANGIYLTQNGNTVALMDSSNNLLLTSGTGGLGYGTGAGGTVTQLTSKSTAVTLNKPSGKITMNNASLAAGESVVFGVNNSLITSSDIINVNMNAGANGDKYDLYVWYVAAGIFYLRLKNIHAISLADALVINFAVIKGANA